VVMKPIFRAIQEITENCGSKIHQKAIADSTVGTMKGMSTIARMNALKGRWLFRRIAR